MSCHEHGGRSSDSGEAVNRDSGVLTLLDKLGDQLYLIDVRRTEVWNRNVMHPKVLQPLVVGMAVLRQGNYRLYALPLQEFLLEQQSLSTVAKVQRTVLEAT